MFNPPSDLVQQVGLAVMAREGKEDKREITFRCPNPDHPDRHPSAKYDPKKMTWNCFPCKSGGGLYNLAELLNLIGPRESRDAWIPKEPHRLTVNGKTTTGGGVVPEPRQEHTMGQRKIAKIYEYTDEDNSLLYQSIRYEPKGFAQRKPDTDGGWNYKLNGVRRVPLWLPDLIAADKSVPVWVPEGEKDAERLRSLGFVATTNAGGTNGWPDDFRDYFAGRDVIIPADNDEPGREFAHAKAASMHGIARSVKVIRLPEVPEKGDISDYLDDGNTVEDLEGLAARTPAWEPPAEGDTPEPMLVLTSLEDVTGKSINWLWNGWLARGKVHIIGGHPGDGKSTLTAALAAILSRGKRFPDDTSSPVGRTLFLLAEDALDDTLKPRLDVHGANCRKIKAIEAVREPDGRDRLFNIERHLTMLEDAIEQEDIDLLVIDPITSFMPKSDRNNEGDVRDVLTPVSKMAERTGVAVLAVMHVGKPDGTNRRPLQKLLGATAFGAVARVVWMVAEAPGSEDATHRVVGVVKSNIGIKPPALEWSRPIDGSVQWHGESFHDLGDLLSGPTTNRGQQREDAKDFLEQKLRGGSLFASEIQRLARDAGISDATLRRAASDLNIEKYKTPGVQAGAWLWKLPNREGAHFPIRPEVSTFQTPLGGSEQRALGSPESMQVDWAMDGALEGAHIDPEKPHENQKMLTSVSIGEVSIFPAEQSVVTDPVRVVRRFGGGSRVSSAEAS